MRRRVFRNYSKGHMDKTKGEVEAREGGGFRLGWGGDVGGKGRQLYLKNKKKETEKKEKKVDIAETREEL